MGRRIEFGHGTKAQSGISWGGVPRDESWGPARGDIQGRQGSAGVYVYAGGGLWQNRLAGAGAMPDGQSLSSGGGDAAGEPGGGDEMVVGHLHGTVQPSAQAVWAFVWWPIQGLDRGR